LDNDAAPFEALTNPGSPTVQRNTHVRDTMPIVGLTTMRTQTGRERCCCHGRNDAGHCDGKCDPHGSRGGSHHRPPHHHPGRRQPTTTPDASVRSHCAMLAAVGAHGQQHAPAAQIPRLRKLCQTGHRPRLARPSLLSSTTRPRPNAWATCWPCACPVGIQRRPRVQHPPTASARWRFRTVAWGVWRLAGLRSAVAARWGQGVGIKGGVVAATIGRVATSQLLSWRAWVRRASAYAFAVGLPRARPSSKAKRGVRVQLLWLTLATGHSLVTPSRFLARTGPPNSFGIS
jgi:hypothetical protein